MMTELYLFGDGYHAVVVKVQPSDSEAGFRELSLSYNENRNFFYQTPTLQL